MPSKPKTASYVAIQILPPLPFAKPVTEYPAFVRSGAGTGKRR